MNIFSYTVIEGVGRETGENKVCKQNNTCTWTCEFKPHDTHSLSRWDHRSLLCIFRLAIVFHFLSFPQQNKYLSKPAG